MTYHVQFDGISWSCLRKTDHHLHTRSQFCSIWDVTIAMVTVLINLVARWYLFEKFLILKLDFRSRTGLKESWDPKELYLSMVKRQFFWALLIFLGTQAILSFVLKKERLLDMTSFDINMFCWCFTFNETGINLKLLLTLAILKICVSVNLFVCSQFKKKLNIQGYRNQLQLANQRTN